MGIKLFSDVEYTEPDYEQVARAIVSGGVTEDTAKHIRDILGNPDANNYRVFIAHHFENAVVAVVRYPSCSNYDGLKIMVFDDPDRLYEIMENNEPLDPHFLEGEELSPVARFEPTPVGMVLALETAQTINVVGRYELARRADDY